MIEPQDTPLDSTSFDLLAASKNIKEASQKLDRGLRPEKLWERNREKALLFDFSKIHENFATHFQKIKQTDVENVFGDLFRSIVDRKITLEEIFPYPNAGRPQLTAEEEGDLKGKFYYLDKVADCHKFLKEIKDDAKIYKSASEVTEVAKIKFSERIAALGYLEGRIFFVRWLFFAHEWHDRTIPCNCGRCTNHSP